MNAIGAWTNLNNDNIAKIIPECPLKNMISLMVDHGGRGAWGHFVSPGTRGRHATRSPKIQYIYSNAYITFVKINKYVLNAQYNIIQDFLVLLLRTSALVI